MTCAESSLTNRCCYVNVAIYFKITLICTQIVINLKSKPFQSAYGYISDAYFMERKCSMNLLSFPFQSLYTHSQLFCGRRYSMLLWKVCWAMWQGLTCLSAAVEQWDVVEASLLALNQWSRGFEMQQMAMCNPHSCKYCTQSVRRQRHEWHPNASH